MGVSLAERRIQQVNECNNGSVELPFGIPFFERGMPKDTYDSGQRIFGIGDPCNSLVVLIGGEAELRRHDVEGKGIILKRVKAPAIFAEGVLPMYPWDAWAVTPAVVRKINMDVLPEVFREVPHFRRLVMETFADYVPLLADLVELLLSPGNLRVEHVLRQMAVKQEDGSFVIEDVPTQRQLAGLTGLTRENVSKIMGCLKENGVIELMGITWRGGIRIPNIEKLRDAFGAEGQGEQEVFNSGDY